jgi:hypothetical protein
MEFSEIRSTNIRQSSTRYGESTLRNPPLGTVNIICENLPLGTVNLISDNPPLGTVDLIYENPRNWHCFSYMYETVCSVHHHSINRAIKTLVIQEIHDELSRNSLPFPCIRAQLRRYVRFVLLNLLLSLSLNI